MRPIYTWVDVENDDKKKRREGERESIKGCEIFCVQLSNIDLESDWLFCLAYDNIYDSRIGKHVELFIYAILNVFWVFCITLSLFHHDSYYCCFD